MHRNEDNMGLYNDIRSYINSDAMLDETTTKIFKCYTLK